MSVFNQYSYVFIGLVLLAAVGFVLYRKRLSLQRAALVLLPLAALLLAGYFVLRPGTGDTDSFETAQATISSGKPTLLEFFSNYCAGCLSVRPAVDRLVSEVQTRYDDQVNVLRVDIHTPGGRQLREAYGFSYTPEFILFNAAGTEVWRGHFPPSLNDVEAAASGAVSSSG